MKIATTPGPQRTGGRRRLLGEYYADINPVPVPPANRATVNPPPPPVP